MFDEVKPLPADPLLGIMAACARDSNPKKVDLGVGEYKLEQGLTPIFASVKSAETHLLNQQMSKGYVGPAGPVLCNQLMAQLIFGADHPALEQHRLTIGQTTGGSGALRIGFELIKRMKGKVEVWVSSPTWANHDPMILAAGLELKIYPYYDMASNNIDFEAMLACIKTITPGNVVLLHACCHNPTGADLNREQWQQIKNVVLERNLFPFIDLAYQGFGDGIDEDAYAVREFAKVVPEMLVASSCSKNFGIYRERTGSISAMVNGTDTEDSKSKAAAVQTHVNQITRSLYSMPPSHGASIVETLLNDASLKTQWLEELSSVRQRILQLRRKLTLALARETGTDRFSFIENQKGMFSFLGINSQQIDRLREEFSIYMAGSSRINIAGLSDKNIDYVAKAIASVI